MVTFGDTPPMRELVYLSQRKLSQFQPERPRGGFLSRITGVGAKAPLSMGEVSLTLAASTTQSVPQLDKVLDELNNRVRGVQWYEDGNIRVGDWTQFEALMNYAVVEEPGLPDDAPLLFWEPQPKNPGDAPTGPSLLLHASSDGLVGNPAGVSGGISESMSDPRSLAKALRQLRHSDDPLSAQSSLEDRQWVYALANIRHRLDEDYPAFMASWFAGYARIIGILPPSAPESYILATPLYVERVSKPEKD